MKQRDALRLRDGRDVEELLTILQEIDDVDGAFERLPEINTSWYETEGLIYRAFGDEGTQLVVLAPEGGDWVIYFRRLGGVAYEQARGIQIGHGNVQNNQF